MRSLAYQIGCKGKAPPVVKPAAPYSALCVRATGIEPVSHAWEARVLPLNDARKERRHFTMDGAFRQEKKKKRARGKFFLAKCTLFAMMLSEHAGIA